MKRLVNGLGSCYDGTYNIIAIISLFCFVYLTNNSLFRKVKFRLLDCSKTNIIRGSLWITSSCCCKSIKKNRHSNEYTWKFHTIYEFGRIFCFRLPKRGSCYIILRWKILCFGTCVQCFYCVRLGWALVYYWYVGKICLG